MRTPDEMMELIGKIARDDDNIRAVLLTGSRADPDCAPDTYQDFDIVYFVRDVRPYWDNMAWLEGRFGKPSLLQKPESMRLIAPEQTGSYVYLMLFPDGNRIDLTITAKPYAHSGEPAVLLLDKDGNFPKIEIQRDFWHVRKPDGKRFSDCCNEFHWCLNNAAKGIARDELSYAMEQLNHYVRDMLLLMLEWYAVVNHGFSVSVGKNGKYLKKLLPADVYQSWRKTYSDADGAHMWAAAFEMLALFGRAARRVAEALSVPYDEAEEAGIARYMEQVKSGDLKY